METDLAYYERRLAEERELASRAQRFDVRAVHLKLAALYEARLAKLKEVPAPTDMQVHASAPTVVG